ncbi:MAG: hypothetical protein NHG36_10980 [Chromatiaceae bacterium]|nr:hypothetical protein [Candidatus Thioaporhodococcus sediminis]
MASPLFGARTLRRAVERQLENPLAMRIVRASDRPAAGCGFIPYARGCTPPRLPPVRCAAESRPNARAARARAGPRRRSAPPLRLVEGAMLVGVTRQPPPCPLGGDSGPAAPDPRHRTLRAPPPLG